ncbi:glycosyltransferase [Bradyrhizobium sp. CCGB12]|uniref:glycosyltransferase n=1 Tax=Bradyrhizobium sp. CCGB12 TaxID=2949632 RepID=UPI0020B1AA50|nr:glycosyltransferase [Bradyrhizobium sp. CCGB12]MCP3392316.1 glycosyltransferase [Bradyrhizobium sp. CCGB12]
MKTISSPTIRAHNSPQSIVGEALWFAATLRKVNPSVVVVYSLRMCLILTLVQCFVRSCEFVYVVTGVGLLGISESLKARLTRRLVFGILSLASRKRSHFIFENSSDGLLDWIAAYGHKTSVFMGAGVDPDEFRMTELPTMPPFRFATVSRLIWSKGIDLAVDAISALAQEGHPVELHIYGVPDLANPHPINPAIWSGRVGIHYHGFSDQVANVWREAHAGIFTSRGGEGLPRALLEASACGRASIVTAVPGCRDFIRDGLEGYVVPTDSGLALKDAIIRLINSPNDILTFGKAARALVCATSTNKIIQAKYEQIFHSLLDGGRPVKSYSDNLGTGRRPVLCDPNDAMTSRRTRPPS